MLRLLFLSVILLISASVHAQPAASGDRGAGTALLVSAGATALPLALGMSLAGAGDAGNQLTGITLALGGIVVGPSVGSFYLGDERRGWRGMQTRAAGTGAAVLGASWAFGAAWGGQDGSAMVGSAFALAGAITLVYGTLYSVSTLPQSARQRSAHVGVRVDGPSGALLPTLIVAL